MRKSRKTLDCCMLLISYEFPCRRRDWRGNGAPGSQRRSQTAAEVFDSRIFRARLFPRSPDRGPIEAFPSSAKLHGIERDFRDLQIPAPLKLPDATLKRS